MKKEAETQLVREASRVFGPTLNKCIALTIFFYVSLILVNAIVFVTAQYKNETWDEAHRPTRLTDILSDAGTLSLGAALGIMKGKFDDDDEDDDESKDEFYDNWGARP